MTDKRLVAILKVLKKPNDTFREIYGNESYYFKPSIVILVLTSFFFVNFSSSSEEITSLPTNEIGYILDAELQIIDTITKILGGFLFTIVIFYLGKKLGGSKNFRGVFSVLSYAASPVLIVGIVLSFFLYYPPSLQFISGIDSSTELREFFWFLNLGVFFPCGIWSFILSIKALKIANNFGTKKAFGIFLLVIIIDIIIWYSISSLVDHPYFG